MLQARVYNLNDEEKQFVIEKWLGREGLQFIQTVTNVEKKHKKCIRTVHCFKREI